MKLVKLDRLKSAITIILCASAMTLLTHSGLRAQAYSWPEFTMEGDTVWHTFPPPDRTYVHDKFAIKFRKGILNKDSLCYDCESIVGMKAGRGKGATPQSGDDSTGYFGDCKHYLMAQQFSVNIISDPVVRTILTANGVTYLTRMTAANPCADTLSLSRFGDTLPMDDFNLMVAHLNNDTSVIATIAALYFTFDGSVEFAEPDYIWMPYSKAPNDPQYAQASQTSLHMIGMDAGMYRGNTILGVWERPEVFPGANNIRVSVVDAGIDFWRCDLGNAQPDDGNVKVIGGFDWASNSIDGIDGPYNQHGTASASVIGALTNNFDCSGGAVLVANGLAGLAGGWGTAGTPPETSQGTGVKLVGYKVDEGAGWDEIYVAGSILESAARSLYGYYGFGVDAINFGGGANYNEPFPGYSINIRNGIAEAYLNGSSFIAAKGDAGTNMLTYPSDHEPSSEIIAVGASNHLYTRFAAGSNFGPHTDLIAPGGDGSFQSVTVPRPPLTDPDYIVDAMKSDIGDSPSASSGAPDDFVWFGYTSASTPNVTGAVALLRGYLQNNSIAFAREDVEGILKSSVLDLGDPAADLPGVNPRSDLDGTKYITGFNDHVGWGFLNVARIFDMLDPTGAEAYQLFHVEIPNEDITDTSYGPWSAKILNQEFYTPYSGSTSPNLARYDVKWREVTATGSYAGLGINTDIPVYVWGNTGISFGSYPERWFGKNRGLANLLPNWSEPWCGVTSGQLGNRGVLDGTGTYTNVGVPGIYHQYSTTVTVHTYQYDLYVPGGGEIEHYPGDGTIGMGFTVFGATKSPSGVKSTTQTTNGFSIEPSLATSFANVYLAPLDGLGQFYLYDAIGRTVRESSVLPGMDHFQVMTKDLPSGLYTGVLQTTTGIESAKIIVLH